jgi:hypothetical protein
VPSLDRELLAPGPVVVHAAPLDRNLVAGLPQLQLGVLPHRLVQPVARGAGDVLLHHQRLVQQRRQVVEHITGCRPSQPHTAATSSSANRPANTHSRELVAGQRVAARPSTRGIRMS